MATDTVKMVLDAARCNRCGHTCAHTAEGCDACRVERPEGGPCRKPPEVPAEESLQLSLNLVASADVAGLVKAQRSYGTSWRNRGGVGAFMMLARKWDRLENQTKKHGWDIFKAIEADTRPEGIMDDIRDLRRYLLLVEEHVTARGLAVPQVAKE